jgi:hypothetical protein
MARPNSPPLPAAAVALDCLAAHLDCLAGQPIDCLAIPVPDYLAAQAVTPDCLVVAAGLS